MVLYLNGTAEGKILRTETSVLDEPRLPFHLGATKDHLSFFHGKLDEILFYTRALSWTEVRNLYQMRESGPCKL